MFYGLLPAGMALLVIARNSIVFMIGWEVIAFLAFFLVTTEDHDRQVRETGWNYLVAAKVAAVSLFALLALLTPRPLTILVGLLRRLGRLESRGTNAAAHATVR